MHTSVCECPYGIVIPQQSLVLLVFPSPRLPALQRTSTSVPLCSPWHINHTQMPKPSFLIC